MRCGAVARIGAAAAIALAGPGCSPTPPANLRPRIANYERWIAPKPHYLVAYSRSPDDLVLETARPATPEWGLARAHLRGQPTRTGYVYDGENFVVFPLFSEGLAAVGVPFGRWTYIDVAGRFAFPPRFRKANALDRGVATALRAEVSGDRRLADDGRWMLVRRNGAMTPLPQEIASVDSFSGDLAAFSTTTGRHGYIDHAGAVRIAPTFSAARAFCGDGLAPVRASGAWGLIDKDGASVIPPAYADVRCYSERLAAAKAGEKWGFLDPRGAFAIPPRFDAVGDFSEGLAAFEHRSWPNGRTFPYVTSYGFINRSGEVVVLAKYAAVDPFKFGLAKVGTRRTDWPIYPLSFVVPADPAYIAWDYIDTHGQVIAKLPPP